MTLETWAAVDDYLAGLFVGSDEALDGALRASDAANMPAIAVSAPQGKFLHLLARIQGARRILIAAALTYVAASLASLLNLWRWIAFLRR